ncbi:Ig-like domain-containing protein [Deinococcus kurensis]|uniref:Ig-like domain-containing protein n=1 Tax=Deinococcus kurensis TaxID=2662757 RepID=UPI0012D2AD87|nr:Ig-like domain-containing protein [Deinococcus kurensis]
MNIAFDSHGARGADLILPDPSAWSRTGGDGSDTLITQQGGVEFARFAYGEDRSATISWDTLDSASLGALRDLAAGADAHALRDLSGESAFVVFSAPDDSPVAGQPGEHQVSVKVEFVHPAGPGTDFPVKPARAALRTYGAFTPRWAEAGGKLSLFQPVQVTPGDGSAGVNPNVPVTVTFSADIDVSTFTDASLRVVDSAGRPAAGGWTVQGATATFTTPFGFLPGETFTVEVNADRNGLRGVNGWWLSRDERYVFTVDARAAVVRDSLSFSGFTAVARGLVREADPNGAQTAQPTYGGPVVQLDLMFDDELIAGEGAAQVSFMDEFSPYEGPVRVLSRELTGNTLRVTCTAGNFGQLVVRVRSGTVGLIGKRRGRLNTDATVTFDMSRQSQLYLRQNYPQIKAVSGMIVASTGLLLQDGYFMPDIGIRPATRDNPMPGFYASVLIDLTGPTLYRSPDGVVNTATDGIPDHLQRPGVSANLSFDFEHWLYAHRDGSAAPPLTAVDTNGQLDVSAVTPLAAGHFDVTFNVPLLDGDVPRDALQFTGLPVTPSAVAAIRDGKLSVNVSAYPHATFDVALAPGAWLRGERGFTSRTGAPYRFSVTATDGASSTANTAAVHLTGIEPDGSFSVSPGSLVTLNFDQPVLHQPDSITVERITPQGEYVPVPFTVLGNGSDTLILVSALDAEAASTVVTVRGGPDGVRGVGGQLIEDTLHRRVIRTRYAQGNEPAPSVRPQALGRDVLRASWSFQRGPVIPATPGPWPLTGPGAFLPGGNENNAYVLTDDAPLTGGADVGAFEVYTRGFAAAALVKPTGPGVMIADLGPARITLDLTGAVATLSAQLNFWYGGSWRGLSYQWSLPRPPTPGEWLGLLASYRPDQSELRLSAGRMTVTAHVQPSYTLARTGNALITGRHVQLSELALFDTPVSLDTLEDYFGTI